jgi:DNA-directed RNA polymerase alpha subunit
MKLIKIMIEKNKQLNNNNYGLFKLGPVNTESAQILGNKIRRTLIKNTEGLNFNIY